MKMSKETRNFENEVDESYDSNDEDDETELEEDMITVDENVGKVINVAFEARPPNSSDFHGVKRLLQQLFVKSLNEELSELADLIVLQDFVGCVLKQIEDENGSDDSDSDEGGDDNVYALNTVINISEHQNLACVEKINSFLIATCKANFKTEPDRMKKLLEDPTKQVGLMLTERFINIPSKVALPSYRSLRNDIEKAVANKKKFRFTNLILISKTYKLKSGQLGEDLHYSNPEEELFSEICEFSYIYSVADQRDTLTEGEWDDDGDFEALRKVMVFDASALSHMISKLETAQ